MFLSSDYHKHPLIDRFFCSFLDHEYNILAHASTELICHSMIPKRTSKKSCLLLSPWYQQDLILNNSSLASNRKKDRSIAVSFYSN